MGTPRVVGSVECIAFCSTHVDVESKIQQLTNNNHSFRRHPSVSLRGPSMLTPDAGRPLSRHNHVHSVVLPRKSLDTTDSAETYETPPRRLLPHELARDSNAPDEDDASNGNGHLSPGISGTFLSPASKQFCQAAHHNSVPFIVFGTPFFYVPTNELEASFINLSSLLLRYCDL
ncbi:hypothetical protein C8F01DRAFT_1259974 [Mycena amicta]|nr:hypothetical protein C8F01DRAFT_1259974 [Mycena amicta]